MFARGEMSAGDAVRAAPAGLDAASLHSIRSVLSAACKARIKTLLAGVAEIVVGIERKSLELLEVKAAGLTATERATAAELALEFEPSGSLAALLETVRREGRELDSMAARGISRQALGRAMAAAGVEPQPAALVDDGETAHEELAGDFK
jgi:hypothetical protein